MLFLAPRNFPWIFIHLPTTVRDFDWLHFNDKRKILRDVDVSWWHLMVFLFHCCLRTDLLEYGALIRNKKSYRKFCMFEWFRIIISGILLRVMDIRGVVIHLRLCFHIWRGACSQLSLEYCLDLPGVVSYLRLCFKIRCIASSQTTMA